MLSFLKKHSILISIVFLLVILLSSWQSSSASLPLAIGFLLFSLWMSVSSILEKHKSTTPETEARSRIAREIVLLVLASMIVMVLAGIAGPLAGSYTGAYAQVYWPGFAVIVDLVTLVLVSFTLGFIVRTVMLKLTRS